MTEFRLRKPISKSIAKITSALTRQLPAHIRLLQAHIISNESDPPRIVSFYDSMNHKKCKIKILGFFSSLWRESERYVVFSSQEWKKKKGNSILGALRASNWLFMVVGVLMTMRLLEDDESEMPSLVVERCLDQIKASNEKWDQYFGSSGSSETKVGLTDLAIQSID
ncbi:hypothetical protein YC2023_077630 [Brassica napus]